MTTLGESKLKWDWTKAEGRGCMLREMSLWPVVCWVNSSSQLGHLSGWRGQDSTDSTTHSWRALKHAAQTSICCCRRCSVLQNTQKCTKQELVCVCVAFPPPTVQPQVHSIHLEITSNIRVFFTGADYLHPFSKGTNPTDLSAAERRHCLS